MARLPPIDRRSSDCDRPGAAWAVAIALTLMLAACTSAGDSSADGTLPGAGEDGETTGDATADGGELQDGSGSEIQRELETPSDNRTPVDFVLSAPGASEVRLELTANYWNADPANTIVLRPDGDVFAATLHLGDGQWLYRFRVDGEWVADPENERCVQAEQGNCNSVLVVGEPAPFTEADPAIPRREVVPFEVASEALGEPTTAFVHVPPGYDPGTTYPLLVALHGFGQGAPEWFDVFGLPTVLDNLYAAGLAEPMIVVAPEGGESFFRNEFETHVIDEVLPAIEQEWSVSSDPAQRAITGWSMGGNGAQYLAWQHPDLFGFGAPVAAGGYCFDVVCSRDVWAQEFTGAPDVVLSLYVGEADDLGITANHAAIASVLEEQGHRFTSQIIDVPGHATDGHSARFVRRLLPTLLGDVSAFFTGGFQPAGVVDPDNGCPGLYPAFGSSPYVLPYPVGEAYQLDLGNCSSSFHGAGEPDDHAYDFAMDIGEDITAARGGTVTFVLDGDPDFGGSPGGNRVVIDHGDRTVGIYLHFTPDSIVVASGDEVDQGDLLGLSGASGTNAAYPHLHFIVVEAPGEYPYAGVPVTFAGTSPNPRGLVSGEIWERFE